MAQPTVPIVLVDQRNGSKAERLHREDGGKNSDQPPKLSEGLRLVSSRANISRENP